MKSEGLLGIGSLGRGVFLYSHSIVLLCDNIVSGVSSEQ